MIELAALKAAVRDRQIALLSAWKTDRTYRENVRANRRLGKMIALLAGENATIQYQQVDGVYKGSHERSWLVIGIFDVQDILNLGGFFQQESVVINSRLLSTEPDSFGETILRFDLDKTVYGPRARRRDSHTIMGKTAFALVAR